LKVLEVIHIIGKVTCVKERIKKRGQLERANKGLVGPIVGCDSANDGEEAT